MSVSRYEVELAGKPLVLETGELAQQAGGAVTLRYGDTMLLGVVTASSPRRGIDFFPLSVEFEEVEDVKPVGESHGDVSGNCFQQENCFGPASTQPCSDLSFVSSRDSEDPEPTFAEPRKRQHASERRKQV